MDDVRKGQLAILFLKHQLREKGVRLTPYFRRELGNVAKEIGVPLDEATQFVEIIVRELVDEVFAKKAEDKGEPAKDKASKDTPPADASAGSEGTKG
jgi:hypothetical protein